MGGRLAAWDGLRILRPAALLGTVLATFAALPSAGAVGGTPGIPSAAGFDQMIVGTVTPMIGAAVDPVTGSVRSTGNVVQSIRQTRENGALVVTISPR